MNYIFIPESEWLQSAKIKAQVDAVLDITGPLDLFTGPWIAGGAVRTWMEGCTLTPGQDADIFISSIGVVLYEDIRKRTTGWASCKPGSERTYVDIGKLQFDIELVKQQYASITHLFQSFPFTVCQFATDGKTIVTTEQAIEDAGNRVLHLPEPFIGKLNQEFANKYLKKGYTAALGLMDMFDKAEKSADFSGEPETFSLASDNV